jgi:hypothetical protein
MSVTVIILLALAGLSESAGRLLPLIARRPEISLRLVIGLLVCGTVVEGTVIALWPIAARMVAELVQTGVEPQGRLIEATGPFWTPARVVPLLLCAILAFPLLGPFLHTLLITYVGTGLVIPLAVASGLGWWSAAGCIAVAGGGLATMVQMMRRLIVWSLARLAEKDAKHD